MSQPQPRVLPVAPVRKSVRVGAPLARAFEAFTAGFNRWWPRTHSIGGEPMQEAVIEPRIGGRWYQRSQSGAESEWGKVLVWDPPSRLVLAWQIDPQFQYNPALVSEVEVRFVAESAAVTRVELEHRNLERFGEQGGALRQIVDSAQGWGYLIELFAAKAAAGE
jgi:uncharacterized protein YndB with AHSA1/START domain